MHVRRGKKFVHWSAAAYICAYMRDKMSLSVWLLDLLQMVYCLLPNPMAVSLILSENSCGLYILRPSIRIGCRMFWKSSGLRFLNSSHSVISMAQSASLRHALGVGA